MDYIDIVFDGPPGPTAGSFVEVEDSEGRSISIGEWLQRPDGYWVLRISPDQVADATESYECPVHGRIAGSSECPRC